MVQHRFDAFLCHNRADENEVRIVAHLLVDRGLNPWLDEWNLIPGSLWQSDVERALDECSSCVVFVGPSGLGPWQHVEMRAAIAKRVDSEGFRVIPVLLPGAQRGRPSNLPVFLQQTTWVEFRDHLQNETAIHRLVCGIRGLEPQIARHQGFHDDRCPYRGLQFFDVQHADLFFGREAMAEWLLNDLRSVSFSDTENRFLGIIGPSGSGKSSLARAGLVACIKRDMLEGSSEWPCVVCRPGRDPLESLSVGLAQVMGTVRAPTAVLDLIAEMKNDERALHVSSRLVLHARPESRLVILIDQFEELFTLCTDENLRRDLIKNLLYASSVIEGRTIVIITLRADFYARCAYYPELAAALSDHQRLVGPMRREELARAIKRPAELGGRNLQSGLTERLLDDVAGQPGSLPLLQHALMELWNRAEGGLLTNEAYDEIGRVDGALVKRADKIFNQFSEPERRICRWIFLRLTQPGKGTEDTRRRVLREELLQAQVDPRIVEGVLGMLASEEVRLITTSGEGEHQDVQFVELAHEALIRDWPQLRKWLDEDRSGLHTHRHLTEAAKQWDDQDRNPDYLYREALFAKAEEWSREHYEDLNLVEREFLFESAALKVDELLLAPISLVPDVIEQMSTFHRWVKGRLTTLVQQEDLPDEQRRRVSLALLESDPTKAGYLGTKLLEVEPREFLIIKEALIPYYSTIKGELWRVVADEGAGSDARLRAASALASYDSENPKWTNVSFSVANILVNQNPLFLGTWIQELKSVRIYLIEPLRKYFGESSPLDSVREAAAAALVEFAEDDADLLAELTSEATDRTYEGVFRGLISNSNIHNRALKTLHRIVWKGPTENTDEPINSGRCRAGAAITAMRMGSAEAALDALRIGDDAESLTQFVHRLKARGLRVESILEHLDQTSDEHRLFGLLLALGEFDVGELPRSSFRSLKENLPLWYQKNPRSGIHGACGWLLRSWGLSQDTLGIDRERRPFDSRAKRNWFIDGFEDILYTFVIFQSGGFVMGSPSSEQGRTSEEEQHSVRISRPFAVADRLVTRGQFERFLCDMNLDRFDIDEWSPTEDHPIVSITWPEAVLYCRWLTRMAGLTEADQYYSISSEGESIRSVSENMVFHPDRGGFRLLTEAEWEYACRCGTRTPYSFGSDPSLLRHYGWYLGNSTERRTQVPGKLRPNLRGLFDMHGNVYEWCHDWYARYETSGHRVQEDPHGPETGVGRVLRGGGYNYSARDCRSAYRYFTRPGNRNARIGFRVSRSLTRTT